jgi:lipoprotein-anchoring transpeptidase ErfK/SrfK
MGEQRDSFCTPRGWHKVHSIIGLEHLPNSVFVARQWTGEIYSEELATQFPDRDWILTRIVRLEGLEVGRNKGGDVDTFMRCIYLHGTPDTTKLGKPGSKGCIRLRNEEVVQVASWATTETLVYIR